jgi:hypothetical protein
MLRHPFDHLRIGQPNSYGRQLASHPWPLQYSRQSALSVWHLREFRKETDYRWVAERLLDESSAGDVVYVPEPPDFWAVAPYTVGPAWGSPLAIQDLAPSDDRLGRLIARLDPQLRTALNLEPQTDFLPFGRVAIYTGATAGSNIIRRQPNRILVVQTRAAVVPTVEGYEVATVESHLDIRLIHLHRLSK